MDVFWKSCMYSTLTKNLQSLYNKYTKPSFTYENSQTLGTIRTKFSHSSFYEPFLHDQEARSVPQTFSRKNRPNIGKVFLGYVWECGIDDGRNGKTIFDRRCKQRQDLRVFCDGVGASTRTWNYDYNFLLDRYISVFLNHILQFN